MLLGHSSLTYVTFASADENSTDAIFGVTCFDYLRMAAIICYGIGGYATRGLQH